MSATAAAPVTPDDLLRMPDGERQLELIGGRVRQRDKSMMAAYIGGQLSFRLHEFAERNSDWVLGWSLGYHCFPAAPNDVRRVSVTYTACQRIPVELFQKDQPFMTIVPDLAADTRAMDATDADVAADAEAWLSAGCRVFWDIDVDEQTVRIHRPNGVTQVLQAADTLTAPDLLPGFAVPVADLFRLPGEPRPA
jgi:Uma2 family endonuclease